MKKHEENNQEVELTNEDFADIDNGGNDTPPSQEITPLHEKGLEL